MFRVFAAAGAGSARFAGAEFAFCPLCEIGMMRAAGGGGNETGGISRGPRPRMTSSNVGHLRALARVGPAGFGFVGSACRRDARAHSARDLTPGTACLAKLHNLIVAECEPGPSNWPAGRGSLFAFGGGFADYDPAVSTAKLVE